MSRDLIDEVLAVFVDWRQELGPGAGDANRIRDRDDVNEVKARRLMRDGEYYETARTLLDARLAR